MKSINNIKIIIIAVVIMLILSKCKKEGDSFLQDRTLSIIEMSSNGCKESLKSSEIERYIELEAVGENRLSVKFINASLNCCPGEITCNAFIRDGIFKVYFTEETPAKCDCICFFDLECVIDSMEVREYNLEIYAHGDKPKAKIKFNYTKKLDTRIAIKNN